MSLRAKPIATDPIPSVARMFAGFAEGNTITENKRPPRTIKPRLEKLPSRTARSGSRRRSRFRTAWSELHAATMKMRNTNKPMARFGRLPEGTLYAALDPSGGRFTRLVHSTELASAHCQTTSVKNALGTARVREHDKRGAPLSNAAAGRIPKVPAIQVPRLISCRESVPNSREKSAIENAGSDAALEKPLGIDR